MSTAQQAIQQTQPETYTLQYTAKALAIGEKQLFKILRQQKIIYRDTQGNNLPYQQYISRRYFSVHNTSWSHPQTGTHLRATTHVTQAGLNWLSTKLNQWRQQHVHH